MRDALTHTDTSDAEERVWRAFLELQRELPPNRILAKVAERIGRPSPTMFEPVGTRSAWS
jgi:hypothetical protein